MHFPVSSKETPGLLSWDTLTLCAYETNIKDSAEEISKLLATSQSLISREESDDGEEEIN